MHWKVLALYIRISAHIGEASSSSYRASRNTDWNADVIFGLVKNLCHVMQTFIAVYNVGWDSLRGVNWIGAVAIASILLGMSILNKIIVMSPSVDVVFLMSHVVPCVVLFHLLDASMKRVLCSCRPLQLTFPEQLYGRSIIRTATQRWALLLRAEQHVCRFYQHMHTWSRSCMFYRHLETIYSGQKPLIACHNQGQRTISCIH